MTTIVHLFEHPLLTDAAARLIHEEFWVEVPGASPARMAARLREASSPDRILLALLALADDGELAGVVNLVENDDEQRTHLRPWLAGLVVRDRLRGRGIGSALVRALLAEARRLGAETVYFGTDGPGFYTRLGATLHERVENDFFIMKFTP